MPFSGSFQSSAPFRADRCTSLHCPRGNDASRETRPVNSVAASPVERNADLQDSPAQCEVPTLREETGQEMLDHMKWTADTVRTSLGEIETGRANPAMIEKIIHSAFPAGFVRRAPHVDSALSLLGIEREVRLAENVNERSFIRRRTWLKLQARKS